MRFRGPPGAVVSDDPPGATVSGSGRTARWTGRGIRVTSHASLTYSPDEGRAGRTAGQAATAGDVARWALPGMYRSGVASALGLAVLLAVAWLVGYRLNGVLDPSWRGTSEGDSKRVLWRRDCSWKTSTTVSTTATRASMSATPSSSAATCRFGGSSSCPGVRTAGGRRRIRLATVADNGWTVAASLRHLVERYLT